MRYTVSNQTLFERLKAACARDWQAYIEHDFVSQLGEGSLPAASFRHYLAQDYLFLIQFARAYALAAYKAGSLAEIRESAAAMAAILDEMNLHIEFCAGWGLSADDIEQARETTTTIAYTRYVLDCGTKGDALDLHTALASCVIGYAEIGRALVADPATRMDGNPYRAWIEQYTDDAYQEVARQAEGRLDKLGGRKVTDERFAELAEIFTQVVKLEVRFWDMGLKESD